MDERGCSMRNVAASVAADLVELKREEVGFGGFRPAPPLATNGHSRTVADLENPTV